MYIATMFAQRNVGDPWEKVLYVGETDNCDKSVILDKDYNALDSVWDLKRLPSKSKLELIADITLGGEVGE